MIVMTSCGGVHVVHLADCFVIFEMRQPGVVARPLLRPIIDRTSGACCICSGRVMSLCAGRSHEHSGVELA